MSETLHVTDAGISASNNASVGMLVDVTMFKVGTSNQAHNDSDVDIKGNLIYQGFISFIEVLSGSSVRFVLDIPETVGMEEGTPLFEVSVHMPSGVMYARAPLSIPFIKRLGEGLRINAILTTNACDVSTINVTLGALSSVPSTPYVRRLPDPSTSDFNSVAVLDLRHNADGTKSPDAAIRYGTGGHLWAFSGYERISAFNPSASNLTTSQFHVANLAATANIQHMEVVIVQIISGVGAFAVRKFSYNSNSDMFVEFDGEPFANIATSSVLALWKSTSSPTANLTQLFPDRDGIPDDWMLSRGAGSLPVWRPQTSKSCTLNTLYEQPSTISITALTLTGNDRDKKFSLGGLTLENPNYISIAVGAITQHRAAFDINLDKLEFSEPIPASTPIDLRIFTKEASVGKRIEIKTNRYISDGSNLRYALSDTIESGEYAFVYISGLRQALSSYTYDVATNEIVMTEAVSPGIKLEIRTFKRVEDPGYSTQIFTMGLTTQDSTYSLELPVAPQTKDYVFIDINGINVHNDMFTVNNNIVSLNGPINAGREVEIMIFTNNLALGSHQTDLRGLVNDALLTSSALILLRHGDYPIRLPIPAIQLEGSSGIRVIKNHPYYRIESTLKEFIESSPPRKFSTLHTIKDSEEIVYTHRIDVKSNMIVTVSADFAVELGPGFRTNDGLELMEYVVGFRTNQAKEPDYGRRIKGTGQAGFTAMLPEGVNNKAYSNSSITQSFSINSENIPAGYIDIVAKMRASNASVTTYGSFLQINFNVVIIPHL